MKQLFIFGAGFSNAIAKIPLGRDLANVIYDMAIKTSSENIALKEFSLDYMIVWDYLQDQAKPFIKFLEDDGTLIKKLNESSDIYPIDLEYLLTLIDLNLNNPYIPKGKGVDLQGCPIPYLKGITTFVLENARKFIQHCLAEIMLPKKLNEHLNFKRMMKILELVKAGDCIITFNYDLLIEQGLFEKGIWNPIDGYGFDKISQYEKLINKDYPETTVDLIKLHGSINWLNESLFGIEDEVSILLTNIDDGIGFFNGLEVQSSHHQYRSRYPKNPMIIMPTFLKHFNKSYELKLINRAVESAQSSDKVYVIGYSLPPADTTANFVFSQIAKNSNIIVVNNDERKGLKERLINNYGFDPINIVCETNDINKWVENDLEFVQHKIDKETEDRMQKMIELSDQSKIGEIK